MQVELRSVERERMNLACLGPNAEAARGVVLEIVLELLAYRAFAV
jgi:hypothetical protein